MLVLALKLLLAPALVVASTLAGRRWGASLTGMLVALPVVAGPILLVAHLEHGAAFSAAAARSALLGLVSLAVFAVAFARLASRLAWPGTLALSWVACLAVDVLLVRWHVGPAPGLVAALLGCAVGTRLLPRVDDDAPAAAPAPPSWDLPARAGATAALVLAVTGAAATLGPAVTGVLAPFPIASSVVAAFVLAQRGVPATVATLRGLLLGLVGFAVFCATVAVLAEQAAVGLVFGTALALSLLTQVVVRWAASPARRATSRQDSPALGA